MKSVLDERSCLCHLPRARPSSHCCSENLLSTVQGTTLVATSVLLRMPSVASRAGSSSRDGVHAATNGRGKRRRDEDGDGEEVNGSAVHARRRSVAIEDDDADDGDDVGNGSGGGAEQSVVREKHDRDLRMSYRDLIKKAINARTNMSEFKFADLAELMEPSNNLFDNVHGTQEGILDSRLLVLGGNLGLHLAQEMKIESGFEVEEFLTRAARLMGGQLRSASAADRVGLMDDEEDEEVQDTDAWDWDQLGRRAAALSQRAVTMDHMLGPLASEYSKRNVARAEVIDRSGAKTQPVQLEKKQVQSNLPETSNVVRVINDLLSDVGGETGVNLFRFVLNPHSFSNSVENMFYVSFLIKEGTAAIEDDENGDPILLSCETPEQGDYDQGITRRQIIMELDMAVWRELIAEYDIKDTVIPTRKGAASSRDTWQTDAAGGAEGSAETAAPSSSRRR